MMQKYAVQRPKFHKISFQGFFCPETEENNRAIWRLLFKVFGILTIFLFPNKVFWCPLLKLILWTDINISYELILWTDINIIDYVIKNNPLMGIR